jgi:SMC interacting uncharacterized protein involved in chromosome segregation
MSYKSILARIKKALPDTDKDLLDDLQTELADMEKELADANDDREDLRAKVKARQAENDKFKERAKKAETDLETVKPDADELLKYKALGSLDDLTAKVKKIEGLETKVSDLENQSLISELAGDAYNAKTLKIALGSNPIKKTGDDLFVTVEGKDIPADEWLETAKETYRLERDSTPTKEPEKKKAPTGGSGKLPPAKQITDKEIADRQKSEVDYSI